MKNLCLIAIALIASLCATAKAEFSRDVVLDRVADNIIVVKSTGKSADKKLATPMAVMSAFDTYLFAGIAGVDDGEPKLSEDARSQHTDYFDRLYDGARYKVFVKEMTEIEKPHKNSLGEWEATVSLMIYKQSLDKDLENSGLIKKKHGTERPKTMPTIIIVPYTTGDQSFKDALESDFDMRVAITQAQNEFQKKDIPIIDFEGKLNAALRAMEMESELANSFDTQLIKDSGADVYVTVDLQKNTVDGKQNVGLALKAYQTSTGRALASEFAKIDMRGASSFDRLCALAIQKVSKSFLGKITEALDQSVNEGETITLRVAVDGDCTRTLDEEMDDDGFGITDFVRSWLRKNAVGGKFHQQAKTELLVIFDMVNIPTQTQDGEPQDATDFANRLTRYLKKKGVGAANRIDGSTIYITITD